MLILVCPTCAPLEYDPQSNPEVGAWCKHGHKLKCIPSSASPIIRTIFVQESFSKRRKLNPAPKKKKAPKKKVPTEPKKKKALRKEVVPKKPVKKAPNPVVTTEKNAIIPLPRSSSSHDMAVTSLMRTLTPYLNAKVPLKMPDKPQAKKGE